MAFLTLALAELSRAYSFRSETRNFWRIDPRTNPHLLGALASSALIAVATVVVGPLREVFSHGRSQWRSVGRGHRLLADPVCGL